MNNHEKMMMDFFDHFFGQGDKDCQNTKKTQNNNNFNDDYSNRGKYSGYKLENIVENDVNNGVKLIYAVPGLTKKDIVVSVKNNIISIKSEKEVFYFGRLDTQIKIKFDVLVKNIKCTCENGLLIVNVLREKDELTENIISID